MQISYKDGVRIRIAGKTILFDSRNDDNGDLIFISHAHNDHTIFKDTPVPKICSEATLRLVQYRRRLSMQNTITQPEFEFDGISFKQFNSGHIIGSTSLLIKKEKRTIFYTGDICNLDRFHMKGADLPESDILIMESSYGKPDYVFPKIEKIAKDTKNWVKKNLEQGNSVCLTGYVLGKAQILTKMIEDFDCLKVFEPGVLTINEICESFGFQHSNQSIIPSQLKKDRNKEKFIAIFSHFSEKSRIFKNSKNPIKKATFTGWSINPIFKYIAQVDEAFPLSDHADYKGLIDIVEKVNPEKVFLIHGYGKAFSKTLREEYGFDAQFLMKDQSRLTQFLKD